MIDELKLIKPIHANERYASYQCVYQGQSVFAKQARNDKTRQLIAGLPKNSAVVNDIGQQTQFKFRAPKIILQQGDWILTEWIDADSLEDDVASRSEELAGILASFFMVFDAQSVADQGFRHIFTIDGLAERIEDRLLDKVNKRQLEVVRAAQTKFNQLWPSLMPALQDADIKPDHIFRDPVSPGAFVLIDSEHLSNQWPRFYDLGNIYVKYFMRRNIDFSTQIIRTFLKRSGLKAADLFEPLQAIIIIRAISLHWEHDYDENAEKYNLPRAQALLTQTLESKSLDNILSFTA